MVLGDGGAEAAPSTTVPGPGSFSIGQLKLGLLTDEELPPGWTIDDDATRSDNGMDVPCDDRFGWALDSSSTQAVGRYHAANGTLDVVHTVWAMDLWVALDLFSHAARATAGCNESWPQPLAADGGLAHEVRSPHRGRRVGERHLPPS